jgi:hypothetical protein
VLLGILYTLWPLSSHLYSPFVFSFESYNSFLPSFLQTMPSNVVILFPRNLEKYRFNISRYYFYEKNSNLLRTVQKRLCIRGIFIFGGGNKTLRNVTKMYCQCQISHKRRKKECLGKFKFSLNRLKKQILMKSIFVSASKGKAILI